MKKLTLLAAPAFALCATPAAAVVGYADVVLDYFDSGAGSMAGPYGGTFPGTFPVAVSTSVVLGPDGAVADFLSLPTGSYVTVGFLDEIVADGVGDDIFISEVGEGGEQGSVYVSSDGLIFQLLGIASTSTVTSFDLASIGFTGQVTAVKVVGLDLGGASQGFDLGFVQALPGAVTPAPEPATWAMMILGFGAVGYAARRKRRIVALQQIA